MKDTKLVRNSWRLFAVCWYGQHGVLLPGNDWLRGWVEAVLCNILDFDKALDIVFHNILIWKLRKHILEEQAVMWVEKSLKGQVEVVLIMIFGTTN